MNLIFTVKGENAFRLLKLDPGWELEEWVGEHVSRSPMNKGEKVAARWTKMNKGQGCYPSSVPHAVALMREKLFERGKKDVPAIDGINEVRAMMESVAWLQEDIADRVEESTK